MYIVDLLQATSLHFKMQGQKWHHHDYKNGKVVALQRAQGWLAQWLIQQFV